MASLKDIVLIVSMTLMVFYMNSYKIPVLNNLKGSGFDYPIFPNLNLGIVSNSNIYWLYCHLLSSLLQVIMTVGYTLIKGKYKYSYIYYDLFVFTHWIFFLIVSINIINLGNLNHLSAFCINSILLTTLHYLAMEDKPILYLFVLISPTILEVLLNLYLTL